MGGSCVDVLALRAVRRVVGSHSCSSYEFRYRIDNQVGLVVLDRVSTSLRKDVIPSGDNVGQVALQSVPPGRPVKG